MAAAARHGLHAPAAQLDSGLRRHADIGREFTRDAWGGRDHLHSDQSRPGHGDGEAGLLLRQMRTISANPGAYNNTVFICTPITADESGNLYFGFCVTGQTPLASLQQGGLARISSTGDAAWVSASAMTGDTSMQKVVYNSAEH